MAIPAHLYVINDDFGFNSCLIGRSEVVDSKLPDLGDDDAYRDLRRLLERGAIKRFESIINLIEYVRSEDLRLVEERAIDISTPDDSQD